MLSNLPPKVNLETTTILKKLVEARTHLAELKGLSQTIPNQQVLVNTLSLQEAKDSSEIENIITTHDEVFSASSNTTDYGKPAAKEVIRYSQALQVGFLRLKQRGSISRAALLEIQEIIEQNQAGFRKLPGTSLMNDRTGEVVYIPPEPQHINDLIDNLLNIINIPEAWEVDPLIKMSAIHYQFESIHPFYDGNGRTGRILNILFLVREGLLDMPVLYLSRFINQNKDRYYDLLQGIRNQNAWEQWVLYMLEGVSKTARMTCRMVTAIGDAMQNYKHVIRENHPKVYSQDLINNLFFHPYTKIEFLQKDLAVSYLTARKYLEMLTNDGLLQKTTIMRTSFYVNKALMKILSSAEHEQLRI
ncbi:MAG: Fic family protein [Spirochaetota bacterium]